MVRQSPTPSASSRRQRRSAAFWTSPRRAYSAGGPTIYLGRDMKLSHKGVGITKDDYAAFMRCLSATLDAFEVPDAERGEVVAFITSLVDIVEA